MKTPKRIYLPPSMAVREVELESPICGGSVQFGKEADVLIDINEQSFAEINNNDFSNAGWEVPGTDENK